MGIKLKKKIPEFFVNLTSFQNVFIIKFRRIWIENLKLFAAFKKTEIERHFRDIENFQLNNLDSSNILCIGAVELIV